MTEQTPQTNGPQSANRWLAHGGVILVLLFQLFLEGGPVFWLEVLGALMAVLAMVFIFLPFYQLKKFGEVSDGSNYMSTTVVVDRGLYGVVRHPQYLGYMLLNTAFVCITQNLWLMLLALVSILSFYFLMIDEEKLCQKQFGAEYEQYQARVPRLNFILGMVKKLLP
ncbi:MAG: isoprenylcysteine carboxylmethyltransferase family protein [Anaerolineaceae bacterium]|nr:isoprenylcysteine carboxylmethyltransferase family protein [Anaerolineaceae bacterium]